LIFIFTKGSGASNELPTLEELAAKRRKLDQPLLLDVKKATIFRKHPQVRKCPIKKGGLAER
jgi:hypothetical protein